MLRVLQYCQHGNVLTISEMAESQLICYVYTCTYSTYMYMYVITCTYTMSCILQGFCGVLLALERLGLLNASEYQRLKPGAADIRWVCELPNTCTTGTCRNMQFVKWWIYLWFHRFH